MITTIFLRSVKDPDGWGEVISDLKIPKRVAERLFEFSEYADVELYLEPRYDKKGICGIDVVGGRIVPRDEA